jgi:predicted methyltransferase
VATTARKLAFPPAHGKITMKIAFALLLLAAQATQGALAAEPAIHPSIKAALEHPDRPAKDRERDEVRKPGQVLEFFGVRPGQTLIEYFAAGGTTAEILARAVGPKGKVYMQNPQWVLERPNFPESVAKRLAENRLPNVVRLDKPLNDLGLPRGSVDGAVMNLVFHDMFWLSEDVPDVLKDLQAMLKPGGFVGVVDHAAPERTGDKSAKDRDNGPHRIDEDFARRMFLDAGFVLEAESDVLRNPEDDRQKPFFAPELKGKTTDRFVLRFRKPKGTG